MNEFLTRQFLQIQFAISDFRKGELDLNALVRKLEGIGNIIEGEFLEERLFPLVFDLEAINSELLDKKRELNPSEQEQIRSILNLLETMLVDLTDSPRREH